MQGFGIVMYNALVALPLCLVGAVLAGEFEYTFSVESFPHGYNAGFWFAVSGDGAGCRGGDAGCSDGWSAATCCSFAALCLA